MLKTQKKQGKIAGELSAEEASILKAKPKLERNHAKVSWPDVKPIIKFEEDTDGDSE
jgi:hypothetical protein